MQWKQPPDTINACTPVPAELRIPSKSSKSSKSTSKSTSVILPRSLLSPTKKASEQREHKTEKRTIRFAPIVAEVVGYVPVRTELSADEIRDAWWNAKEYQGIRLAAKFLTKDVRSRDSELVSGIEEAYARALHLSCSLSDSDFDDLINDCSSQISCLQPWCARRLSARGLERYTSKKHRFERTEYAVETRAAVLRLAQNSNVSEEDLSSFYREYARSAALYARFCGQADYAVAADESFPPVYKKDENNDSNSTLATVSTISSGASLNSPKTAACDGRRDLMRRSKEPSRGRLLVRELSQRIVETTV